jgi:aspartate aminotransferase
VYSEAQLREICEAVVAENLRREEAGERPLFLLYDQVYWKLTFGDAVHHSPPALVPAVARWTILVDAISKSWAATGVRVGWCVTPPWLREKMTPLLGHMGAWAGRAEQAATADLLENPRLIDDWMEAFSDGLRDRLQTLADGIHAMKRDGLPIDCLEPQGAMYLTVRAELHGRTIDGVHIEDDDAMRQALLQHAGVGVVPFTAFGYPDGSGWFRMAVGAVTMDEVTGALERLRAFLARI